MKTENVQLVLGNVRIKTSISQTLLGICFGLFTFIVAVNPSLLKENLLVATQLTLAIPFLTSSIFSRTKLITSQKREIWNIYGYLLFTLSYSFIVNVVGILLSTLISLNIGLVFFGVNILLAIIYSGIKIYENKTCFKTRLLKDLLFVSIIVLLGILPSLG